MCDAWWWRDPGVVLGVDLVYWSPWDSLSWRCSRDREMWNRGTVPGTGDGSLLRLLIVVQGRLPPYHSVVVCVSGDNQGAVHDIDYVSPLLFAPH